MTILFLDLETYCEVPIKHGTNAYAEQVEILMLAYAYGDAPVSVVDFPAPAMIQALVDDADEVVIHNSYFDRTVLNQYQVRVPTDKITDTMVLALAHGLPGALGKLCDILGVPTDKAKDKAGKQLINLFCKPRPKNMKLRRATSDTHPADWQRFREYAALDVDAMRDVYGCLPRWNVRGDERDLWRLDQDINDRGVAVDRELARAALRAAERAGRSLAARTRELTADEVQAATQRDKLIGYIAEAFDFPLEDLRGATVEKILENSHNLPIELRELLAIRLQASSTSPAKYQALLRGVSRDGRLRGTLQFCGAARTGRWAGRLFQPQNLPRPSLKQPQIEAGIEAMKQDAEDLVFDDVMELCASAIRGCIVAPAGKKLVVADLSNIEGRMLAWLAGEDWKLKAFAEFDQGIGHDLYILAYARAYGLDPDQVTKDNRQIGKVMELALGYQGAVGAFSSMAAIYGVVLPEDVVLSIVKAWRKAHPATSSFWYELQEAALMAVGQPGTTITCRKLKLGRTGSWLRIRLPSGRYLCYPGVRVEDGKLSYMGVNQYTRKWERLRTYGGKLVENVTQAAARDVLAHGMVRAEAAGYEIVLSVHDELITETPDYRAFDEQGLAAIMSTNPPWAEGLPLAAAGFTAYRYRKD